MAKMAKKLLEESKAANQSSKKRENENEKMASKTAKNS
jgi:hypothetical protein